MLKNVIKFSYERRSGFLWMNSSGFKNNLVTPRNVFSMQLILMSQIKSSEILTEIPKTFSTKILTSKFLLQDFDRWWVFTEHGVKRWHITTKKHWLRFAKKRYKMIFGSFAMFCGAKGKTNYFRHTFHYMRCKSMRIIWILSNLPVLPFENSRK